MGTFECGLRWTWCLSASFCGLPWNSVFPYLCHEIWKDRNTCVFKAKDPAPIKMISFRECKRFQERFLEKGNEYYCVPAVWSPLELPHDSCWCFLVGPNELIGIGGVVRDNNRNWLLDLAAELLAILEAMQCMKSQDYLKCDHLLRLSECDGSYSKGQSWHSFEYIKLCTQGLRVK